MTLALLQSQSEFVLFVLLCQAYQLIRAVSVLLNFTREEEDLLKQTLEYKVGISVIVFSLQLLKIYFITEDCPLNSCVCQYKIKFTEALFLEYFCNYNSYQSLGCCYDHGVKVFQSSWGTN